MNTLTTCVSLAALLLGMLPHEGEALGPHAEVTYAIMAGISTVVGIGWLLYQRSHRSR